MATPFEGKIFIRGNHKIPKNSYLIFSDGKDYAVYRSENVTYLQGAITFKLVGDAVNDVTVDFVRRELRLGITLVNNVKWYSLTTHSGNKLRITQTRFKIPFQPLQYLLSVASLGILGCLFLKQKHEELNKLADRLDKTQNELCDVFESRILGSILNTADEIAVARFLKQSYGTFRNLKFELDNVKQEVVDARKTFVTMPKEDEEGMGRVKAIYGSWERLFEVIAEYKELEKAHEEFGDLEWAEALRLKNTFGTLGKIRKELNDFQHLKDNHGSLESIINKLTHTGDTQYVKRLEEANRLLQEKYEFISAQLQDKIGSEGEIRSFMLLKKSFHGDFNELSSTVKRLSYLQSRYGSIDEIQRKLEGIQEMEITINRLRADALRRDTPVKKI